MARRFTAAIVGAGRIAGGYDAAKRAGQRGVFSHAGAYRAAGSFTLKTVCDVDPARARAFQRRWKVPFAAGLSELTRSFHDAVSVCVPDELHFPVTRALLEARCCRAIFLEKPAARTRVELERLIALSAAAKIAVVVGFQRRFEPAHRALRARAAATPPLAVNAYYIKGLRHIGTTMVDTLIYLFGRPRSALAFDAVYNREVRENTVDFALYFEGFTATARSADRRDGGYAYHIFEVDALFADGRVSITDNSRRARESRVGAYAYAGVKALGEARVASTTYDLALKSAVEHLGALLAGRRRHDVNRLEDSYNDALVVEAIERSLRCGRRVEIPEERWKP